MRTFFILIFFIAAGYSLGGIGLSVYHNIANETVTLLDYFVVFMLSAIAIAGFAPTK